MSGIPHTVEGYVRRDFEGVRDAFAENFVRRQELGGACCAYHRGETGRRPLGRHPEQADGRAVGARHHGARLLGDQGPGRDDAGARPLARLARLRRARLRRTGRSSRSRARSGSPSGSCWRTRPACSRSTSRSIATLVADLDRLAAVLARQKPAWEPGTRQAYHAHHARVLRERAAAPRRSAASQPRAVLPGRDRRAARPRRLHPAARGRSRTRAWRRSRRRAASRCCCGFPLRLMLDAMNRALQHLPGAGHESGRRAALDAQRVYARNLEVPSGGGVGTARAIAHAYGVFATGGRELGLRRETLDAARRAGDPADARVPRRVHEGRRRPVLARVHEAEPGIAVRQRPFVRRARRRRLAGLRRSGRRRRLRLRDEPDGHAR